MRACGQACMGAAKISLPASSLETSPLRGQPPSARPALVVRQQKELRGAYRRSSANNGGKARYVRRTQCVWKVQAGGRQTDMYRTGSRAPTPVS